MKVVIDIDEDTYKDIKKGKVYSSMRDIPQESVLAIAHGTPLPEGHGRLIDADILDEVKEIVTTDTNDYKYAVTMDDIRLIPTIIGADM